MLGTYRTHRAACPQGPTFCTYGVAYQPRAFGVSCSPHTVATQVTSAPTLVGAEGEVAVAVGAGGWLAEPEDRCGRSTLRFYLDFPDGAERNGASLPPGRVFFSSACW